MTENVSRVAIMAQKYESIIERTKDMTFSYAVAVKLVGGRKRLERLMQEQKVRYDKPFGSVNARWQFSANDILSNVKPLPISRG